MAVKIKINWENESVMSESVRIYRADSAFTSNSLPPLLAEVVGDIYEYEDLTTEKDETYFYMLSARLGEQEVFTDCFEVFANKADVPIIVGIDSESVLTPSLSLRSTFYSKNGDYIYIHNTSITSKVQFLKHATSSPFGDYFPASTSVELLPNTTNTFLYASFFNDGFGLCIITGSSIYKRYIFELSKAYEIETAVLKNEMQITGVERSKIVGQYYIVASAGTITIYQITGDIFSNYSLVNSNTYNIPTNFTYCFDVASDGKSIVLVSGNRTTAQDKKIVSLKSDIAFNFSSFEQVIVNRGVALSVTRGNNTNRFLYTDFMLLYDVNTDSLLKVFFTKP
ncbi:hypothetical protein [Acinetobacter sp. P1332]|jgi:hypothetical protein|uniref:hypothetical protein n=1 Tax=Acinetobacter sp. P1332 TaxID=3366266 RepID=UPI0037564A3D